MLSRFFKCQWENSNHNDWTTQIRTDLSDFEISMNLQDIKKISTHTWKKLIRKKAKKFEFGKLMEIKNIKNKSKMDKLHYKQLESQDYLEELNVNEAKTVFRFRTRMQNFAGNFKGKSIELCPLCYQHYDLQELCFECPIIRKKIIIKESYESIFGSTITRNMASLLVQIDKIRKEENLSQSEAQ